ncbi:MAG: competence/damage-inducible protein A [Polyangiaceae bacterium]|nr:competence/damage-inducible protein A [Polyangiaceae bacterium]
MESAAALLIGDELLSGKVGDQNLHALATTLRSLGIELCRASIVRDDVEVIAREVAELSRSHDVVFTSGGVGPTHDDVTMQAVAQAFGVATTLDPLTEHKLRDLFGTLCRDAHLRMATVPEGATLAVTAEGAWPTVIMRNVWILPGVPEIFRNKLGVVREQLCGPTPFFSRAVLTGLTEPELVPLLEHTVPEHSAVTIGSYPNWSATRYRTKVTFDARDPDAVGAALDAFVALLPEGGLVGVE